MTASSGQRSEERCVEANCEAASLRLRIRNCCGTPAALPAPKSGWGIEAATPGLPVALGAFLEVFPPAIRIR